MLSIGIVHALDLARAYGGILFGNALDDLDVEIDVFGQRLLFYDVPGRVGREGDDRHADLFRCVACRRE